MRKIVLFIATLITLLTAAPVVTGSTVSAWTPFGTPCSVSSSTTAGSSACTVNGANDPLTGKNGILYKTSRVLAIIAAIGAVIMVIIGGFMFITAGGDANKAASARKVVISACAGIGVIALAEAIIAFAVNVVR